MKQDVKQQALTHLRFLEGLFKELYWKTQKISWFWDQNGLDFCQLNVLVYMRIDQYQCDQDVR